MKKNNLSESEGLMSTIIGKDTIITGTVDVKGDLRIDGTVNGKVICSECVTIGPTGIVDAEVDSNSAIIAGKMRGNILNSEKVELQTNCEMDGDLKTKSLVIEQGAVFCGACNMKNKIPDLGFLPPQKNEKIEKKDSLKFTLADEKESK